MSIGFVDVMGAVEPTALAGEISMTAHRRVGGALVEVIDTLDEEGIALNQLQRMELVSAGSLFMDGFAQEVLDAILRHVERIRVRTEGDDAS